MKQQKASTLSKGANLWNFTLLNNLAFLKTLGLLQMVLYRTKMSYFQSKITAIVQYVLRTQTSRRLLVRYTASIPQEVTPFIKQAPEETLGKCIQFSTAFACRKPLNWFFPTSTFSIPTVLTKQCDSLWCPNPPTFIFQTSLSLEAE